MGDDSYFGEVCNWIRMQNTQKMEIHFINEWKTEGFQHYLIQKILSGEVTELSGAPGNQILDYWGTAL